jgi:hypothetical protein
LAKNCKMIIDIKYILWYNGFMRFFIFGIICSLFMLSCENKRTLNTESEKNSASVVSATTEDVPIASASTDETEDTYSVIESNVSRTLLSPTSKYLDSMYELYSKESRQQYRESMHELFLNDIERYIDTMYKFWTLGNRYTTISIYGYGYLYFSLTFIHNLEGFSNAIIVAPSIIRNYPLPDEDTRDSEGNIFLSNYGSFTSFQFGYMHFGDSFSFYSADDGLVVLSQDFNNQFESISTYEIQYKYQDDELSLFYFGNDKSPRFEMTEIIYEDNKMVININDVGRWHRSQCLFMNEGIDELRKLYITVLKNNFLSAIEYMTEYNFWRDRGREGRLHEVLGAWTLTLLTETEITIFEECISEYFYGRDERFKELHNYRQIMELLEEVKK